MKRWIAGILCIAMLLSLLAGCGAPAEETQAAAETVMQAEPTTEPTTEPTIDPEELFLQSLPADVRRAYEVGLVTREDLNDLERSVTVGEAALILQKAQTHRAGTESPVLADLMTHETFAQRNADRGWLMGIPALIDLEQAYASRFESYEQWTQEVLKIQYGALELHYAFSARLGMSVYMTGEKTLGNKKSVFDLTYNADGDEYLLSAWDVIMGNAPDGSVYEEGADALYVKDPQMLSYALELHDGTTGKKFMQMEKAEFDPFRELTFGEVVESALRLYNAPNPVAWPEFVAVEEVGAYNTDIITADLLNKETDLPEASCEKLPSNWHGVVFNDLQTIGIDTMHQDAMVYEYEIQAVKDAGFNYIGLYLDFSWLQDYTLFESKRVAFGSILNNQDKGKISMERLEQLDQILAWCMERDIHVNLRACSLPNINQDTHIGLGYQLDMNGKNYASILAAMWQAIARRYADIPNEYLSFTLLSTVSGEDAATLLPSVDAIREESPDRCIIAEMHSFRPQAEAFAQKGVALSSRLFDYEGVSPFLNHSECTQWDSKYRTNFLPDKCLDTIRSFTWPYNGSIDAAALFSYRLYSKIPSTMDVINTAKEYGVGCMLSDFGVRINEWGNWDGMSLPRFRYPLDAYKAMIQDIVTSAEDLELGWCFAYWYSPYGVAFGTPLFDDTTYTQVEDYPYYIDQTILGWFQEINNKSSAPQAAAEVSSGVPKDAKAVVDALRVPEEQYSCYLAAAEAGISLDNISDKPINAREMVTLVDQFMAHAAPDKLAGWKTQYPAFRGAPLEPISRMDAMAYLFLAMRYTEDPAYADPPSFVCFLMDQVEMDWDAEYLNWQLFGGFESLPTYPVDFYEDVYTDCTLDGAAHYFNLGWRDGVTGDYLLDLDPATNTFLYQEDATWQDVILALGRLLPKTNDDLVTTLFPDSTFLLADEDGAKIEAYRAQAAARKEAIVNSKTSIVKSDTFVPGETYSGKAYYVSPDGDDSNDGLTPETAWKTTNAVTDAHYSNKLKKGDAVFFRRGGTYRVDPCKSLAVHEGVTYSAYGEGEKPILTLSEGNKADPGFWQLYYDKDGMKIWKYHQQITDVGGIVFNDSSYATRVYEWPDNGKWQAVDVQKLSIEEICDSWSGSPVRYVGTGEYRKVEENMPENLTYISRVDISGASYPINFVENPKTGMPYTGELYLRCDEGNPGDVFDEIAILGYSDVSKGSWFQIITAFDVDDFVLDNLCIKYYVDTAVCGGLKAENVVIQNCVVGWGGNRMHEVSSPEPTATFASIGDGIYCIANNATIRNNYMYMSANGCTFENGPMGYEKKMGVYTCTGNLMENCSEGIRAFLIGLDEGDVPFEKMVIQDNMILDTGVSINNGNSEIPAAIDISKGEVFAEEILVADNICIGSTVAMMRMGNPLTADAKETYRGNVWAHDPKLPMAAMMNIWSNTWVSMDGAK